ncbi:MAG: AlpA family phage regulatory protein [Candidatus Moranbacteria bacterium]|nr:AlpA family phage regulatory protein [Candidatus Moranbacteria bacterium]
MLILHLDINDTAKAVDLSPATIDRMCKAGTFPAPVRLGGRKSWRVRDLEAWSESLKEPDRIADRPKRGRPRLAV